MPRLAAGAGASARGCRSSRARARVAAASTRCSASSSHAACPGLTRSTSMPGGHGLAPAGASGARISIRIRFRPTGVLRRHARKTSGLGRSRTIRASGAGACQRRGGDRGRLVRQVRPVADVIVGNVSDVDRHEFGTDHHAQLVLLIECVSAVARTPHRQGVARRASRRPRVREMGDRVGSAQRTGAGAASDPCVQEAVCEATSPASFGITIDATSAQ